jgi:hypothetical protein
MLLQKLPNNQSPQAPAGACGLFYASPPEEHHERRTICRLAAIQERVTAVLRSIPKEAFANSLQKLCERCQQCVVKDGDYFEVQ